MSNYTKIIKNFNIYNIGICLIQNTIMLKILNNFIVSKKKYFN